MWWAMGVSLAATIIVSGLAVFFGRERSRLAREVGEHAGTITALRAKVDDLEKRIRDQAALLELLAEPDPPLSDLERMSEDDARRASPDGGGLSPLESRAARRIFRAGPARETGEGEGG